MAWALSHCLVILAFCQLLLTHSIDSIEIENKSPRRDQNVHEEIITYRADLLVNLLGTDTYTEIEFEIHPVLINGSTSGSLLITDVTAHRGGHEYINTGDYEDHLLQLQKPLYFEITGSGVVGTVFHDSSDDTEIISLKKYLLSLLSANLQIQKTDVGGVEHFEIDHSGIHQHTYHVSEENDHKKITKRKDDGFHKAEKVLWQRGNGYISKVISTEHFGPKRTVHKRASPLMTGHHVTATLEFVSVRTTKYVKTIRLDELSNLVKGTLHHTEKEEQKGLHADDLEEQIRLAELCLQNVKSLNNKTECVSRLAQSFEEISSGILNKVMWNHVTSGCDKKNALCDTTARLVLEATGMVDTATAQLLIVRYIKAYEPSNQDMKQTLLLLNKQDQSTQECLDLLHDLCFGKENKLHGIMAIHETQMTSCLVLGNKLSKLDQESTEVLQRIDLLHSWVSNTLENVELSQGLTEETIQPIENHAKSVIIHTLGNINHPHSKHVLINSLDARAGHAVVRRSAVNALRKYTCIESATALLNTSIHDHSYAVRRTAFDIYKKHPQAFELSAMDEDILFSKNRTEVHIVKRESVHNTVEELAFASETKLTREEWSRQAGDNEFGFRASGYDEATLTYDGTPIDSKVRIVSFVHKKVEAWIELEKLYHYDVMDGELCLDREFRFYNSSIFADHGLDQFFSKIYEYDTSFEENMKPIVESVNAFYANLGTQECYLGNISIDESFFLELAIDERYLYIRDVIEVVEYHTTYIEHKLNADFSGELVKLANIDGCIRSSFTSYRFIHDIEGLSFDILNCVRLMNSVETKPVGMLEKIYKLQDIVISLPEAIQQLHMHLNHSAVALSTVSDTALYAPLKKLLNHIQGFVSQMRSDINFFSMYMGQECFDNHEFFTLVIDEASQAIGETVALLQDQPPRSLSVLQDNFKMLKLGLVVFEDSKARMLTQSNMQQGKVPSWMELSPDIEHIFMAIEKVKNLLQNPVNINKDTPSPRDMLISNIKRNKTSVHIGEWLDVIITDLQSMLYLSDNYTNTVWQLYDVMKVVSYEFETFSLRIDKASAHVRKSFGMKFDPTFPNQVRSECDEQCGGCGIYPNMLHARSGVQLLALEGTHIVAPISGLLKQMAEDSTVILYPNSYDLIDYEIVLTYIEINQSFHQWPRGVYVNAGQVIGAVTRSPCQPNYIHMAIRYRNSSYGEGTEEGAGGIYTKADEFYEKPEPVQIINQQSDCNTYERREYNQYVDIVDMSSDIRVKASEIQRKALNIEDNLEDHIEFQLRPIHYDTAKMSLQFIDQINAYYYDLNYAISAQPYSLAYNTVDGDRIAKPEYTINRYKPKPTDYLNVLENYTLEEIADVYRQAGLSSEAEQLELIQNNTIKYLTAPIDEPIETLPKIKIRSNSYLNNVTLDTYSDTLVSHLYSTGTKGCNSLQEALSLGFGHACRTEQGCQLVVCNLELQMNHREINCDINMATQFANKVVTITFCDTEMEFHYSDAMGYIKNKTTIDFYEGDLSVTLITGFNVSNRNLMSDLLYRMCLISESQCTNIRPIWNNFQVKDTGYSNESQYKNKHLSSLEYMPSTKNKLQEKYGGRLIIHPTFGDWRYQNCLEGSSEAICNTRTFFNIMLFPFKTIWRNSWFKRTRVWYDFDLISMGIGISDGQPHIEVLADAWIRLKKGWPGLKYDIQVDGTIEVEIVINMAFTSQSLATESEHFNITVDANIKKFKIQWTVAGTGMVMKDFTHNPLRKRIGHKFLPIPWGGTKTIMRWLVVYPIDALIDVLLDLIIHGADGPDCNDPSRMGKVLFISNEEDELNLWHTVKILFIPLPWDKTELGSSYFGDCSSFCVPVEADSNGYHHVRSYRNLNAFDLLASHSESYEGKCGILQQMGRDKNHPAISLDSPFYDTTSGLFLEYAIGRSIGNTDVKDWAKYRGAVQIIDMHGVPSGIPLYITTKATNKFKEQLSVSCSLPTLDITPPTGRIENKVVMTSHPHELHASLIIVDDSPLVKEQYTSVGKGENTDDTVPWHVFELSDDPRNSDAEGALQEFATGRQGRLNVEPLQSTEAPLDSNCAEKCLKFGDPCVSFDFDYASNQCNLHSVIEGTDAKLVTSAAFYNFERLGQGLSAYFSYNDLNLSHGNSYYFNALVTNDKGYRALLSSQEVVVDFTPPIPGHLENVKQDIMRHDPCNASILHEDRCEHVTPNVNHRVIIDGPGSRAVFNGNQIGFDLLYTLINHYIAGSWDGFYDDETGLWAYTWAVGTAICGSDIQPFEDPHSHLADSTYWTNQGVATDLSLPDGKYYVTVQAMNNIVYGGSLVTTVCHSTPLIIDTTPPIIHLVDDVFYDAYFDILGIYYSASDDESGVVRTDVGLGETKHDVLVMAYTYHDPLRDGYEMVSIDDAELPTGVAMYVRIRVTNNVDLMTSSHGEQPIMLDPTPPDAGYLLDGDVHLQDLAYQSYDNKICAQWYEWFDQESGIDRYVWGVGTYPNSSDVVSFKTFEHTEVGTCENIKLSHSVVYYSTLQAYNKGLNSRSTIRVSNGVMVDLTDPVAGWVSDGGSPDEDINYSSESASVYAHWGGFQDPESGIDKYTTSVYINNMLAEVFTFDGLATTLEDHTLHFKHGDYVYVAVEGENGASRTNKSKSDGYTVDLTKPSVMYVRDHEHDLYYQTSDSQIYTAWQFTDPESHIFRYDMRILQYSGGQTHKYWPTDSNYISYQPDASNQYQHEETINVSLSNGRMYIVEVAAGNKAGLGSTQRSKGVIVDVTEPTMYTVYIGPFGADESLNDDGQVIHADHYGIQASWSGVDHESNIKGYFVAVGTTWNDTSVTNGFRDFGIATSGYIDGLYLEVSSNGTLYYVLVKAENNAGAFSSVLVSKPIYVYEENVAGQVFDGRLLFQDRDYSRDTQSVGMSFLGFKSAACGIRSYEWAIGSHPGYSDIAPFSSFGLVMRNDSHGQAQLHVPLQNGMVIFITVRAYTGNQCPEGLIESSSDGMTIDVNPPNVNIESIGVFENFQALPSLNLYQQEADSITMEWNATDDESEILIESWKAGSLPFHDDFKNETLQENGKVPLGEVSLESGETVFFTILTSDYAMNILETISPSITIDTSPPVIHKGITCTRHISNVYPFVTCTWSDPIDNESPIVNVSIAVGRFQFDDSVHEYTVLGYGTTEWTAQIKLFYDEVTRKIIDNSLFVTLKVVNSVNLVSACFARVVVDTSPPNAGIVQVTTPVNPDEPLTPRICQMSTTTMQLHIQGFSEEESEIERYEVGIGTSEGISDIHCFTDVGNVTSVFLNGLNLQPGTLVYVSVRALNSARLSSKTASSVLFISPTSEIFVSDGLGRNEINYQNDLSAINGQFNMKYPCPILQCQWHVEDITGKKITNATVCYDNQFQNDELELINFHTYVVFVDALDVINRTLKGKSNGVMTVIEPPYPGAVRDGLYQDEDWDYQASTTQLSFNWDAFGSDDTWQEIIYYEVAIGDDPSYSNTRTNVHYFVNVGLNQSYTFHNLNLTEHTSTYYGTVRGKSVSNAYTDSTSNGIQVGYEEIILSSKVYISKYSGSTSSLLVSWDRFISDFPMQRYLWGIGKTNFLFPNKTGNCERLIPRLEAWSTEMIIRDRGLDTIDEVCNLNLKHGDIYFVTILGEAVGDLCTAAVSESFLVDITEPVSGHVIVGGESEVAQYVTASDRISITLDGFYDLESGINSYTVQLLQYASCLDTLDMIPLTQTTNIGKMTLYSFFGLTLELHTPYFVAIETLNNANLSSQIISQAVFLDTTPPLAGSVYAGADWTAPVFYQSSSSDVLGTLAITPYDNLENCSQYSTIIPGGFDDIRIVQNRKMYHLNSLRKPWNHYMTYNDWNVNADPDGTTHMRIHTNISTNKLDSAALVIDDTVILEGKYTLSTKIGKTSISEPSVLSFALLEKLFEEHVEFELPEVEEQLSDEDFLALGDPVIVETDNDVVNATDVPDVTTFVAVSYILPNMTNASNIDSFSSLGIGFHILCFPLGNKTTVWKVLFWARGFDGLKTLWGDVPADPSAVELTYSLTTKHISGNDWQVGLLVNNEIIALLGPIELLPSMSLAVRLWSHNEVVPPVTNPFYPFESVSAISKLLLPIEKTKICHYGTPFTDAESGIHSFEIEVIRSTIESNSDNFTTSVQQIDVCHPCVLDCDAYKCTDDCIWEIQDYYYILNIHVSQLNLSPGIYYIDENGEFVFHPYIYNLQVEVTNEAGLIATAQSNWLRIDDSPPNITHIHAFDPDYVSGSPSEFQGSNSTLAAFWEFNDMESPLVEYIIFVGTSPYSTNILKPTSVGTDTEVVVDGLEGLLKYGSCYFVTVTGYNAAGLSTTGHTAGITPLNEEPQMEDITSQPFQNDSIISFNDSLTFMTRRQNSIAVTLSGVNKSNLYMLEWSIGLSVNDTYLMIPTNVPANMSALLEIRSDGYLWYSNYNTSVSLSRISMQLGQQDMSFEDEYVDPGSITLEPGRCLYSHIVGLTKAHRSEYLKLPATCIKRERDEVIAVNGKMELLLNTEDAQITICADNATGMVLSGNLSDGDLSTPYHNSANLSFSPYIVNPTETCNQTSRALQNRLSTFAGITFILAPAPTLQVNTSLDISIQLPLYDTASTQDDLEQMLLYWKTDERKWYTSDYYCSDNPRRVSGNSVKFCQSPDINWMLEPTMFAVFWVKKGNTNQAPSLTSNNIFLQANHHKMVQLQYNDDEGDEVLFKMAVLPSHGIAQLSTNGLLFYQPEDYFFGQDYITLTLTEINLPKGVQGNEIEETIGVSVREIPFSPFLYFVPHHERKNSFSMYSGTIDVSTEGNTTTKPIGDIYICDYNPADDLGILYTVSNSSVSVVMETVTNPDMSAAGNADECFSSNQDVTSLGIVTDANFHGVVLITLIAYDSANKFSQPVSVNISVLISPCGHGSCFSNHDPECTSTERANSFEGYECSCDAWYQGDTCTEFAGWGVALILLGVVMIIGIIGGAYRFKKRSNKVSPLLLELDSVSVAESMCDTEDNRSDNENNQSLVAAENQEERNTVSYRDEVDETSFTNNENVIQDEESNNDVDAPHYSGDNEKTHSKNNNADNVELNINTKENDSEHTQSDIGAEDSTATDTVENQTVLCSISSFATKSTPSARTTGASDSRYRSYANEVRKWMDS